MNAYLFSGVVSQYYKGSYTDFCSTLILYGAEEDTARKTFREFLLRPETDENLPPKKIEMVVGAPVLDQLLTEAGNQPIRWSEIAEELRQTLESTGLDDETQGYWLDCEQVVKPETRALGIDSLQRSLPEDIRSGLNWSADKNYFFLLSVLSPPSPPTFADLDEENRRHDADRTGDEPELEGLNDADSEQRLLTYPQLAKKETALIIRARNSAVATWLWRQFAPETSWATCAIRIDPLCESIRIGDLAL
jgi:hypothetical protein